MGVSRVLVILLVYSWVAALYMRLVRLLYEMASFGVLGQCYVSLLAMLAVLALLDSVEVVEMAKMTE